MVDVIFVVVMTFAFLLIMGARMNINKNINKNIALLNIMKMSFTRRCWVFSFSVP